MSPPIKCKKCGCPCHCKYEKHSNWGGPPSEFSGECECSTCECKNGGET